MAWRNAGKTENKVEKEVEKPKKGVRFVEDMPDLGTKLKVPE